MSSSKLHPLSLNLEFSDSARVGQRTLELSCLCLISAEITGKWHYSELLIFFFLNMGAGAQSKACEVNTLPSKSLAQPHVSFFLNTISQGHREIGLLSRAASGA